MAALHITYCIFKYEDDSFPTHVSSVEKNWIMETAGYKVEGMNKFLTKLLLRSGDASGGQ
jgi:hypothetical protein